LPKTENHLVDDGTMLSGDINLAGDGSDAYHEGLLSSEDHP